MTYLQYLIYFLSICIPVFIYSIFTYFVSFFVIYAIILHANIIIILILIKLASLPFNLLNLAIPRNATLG